MKKYCYIILLLTSFVWLSLTFSAAAEYSLVEVRIASVLIHEMGGVAAVTGEKNNEPLTRVAEVMRNMYNYQHKKGYTDVTYSDVLFGGQHFENARVTFAGKTKEQLEREGSKEPEWNIALGLAHKMVTGTLTSDIARGANAFNANCEDQMSGTVAEKRRYTNSLQIGSAPSCLIHLGKQYRLLAVQKLPEQGAKGMRTATFWNWELGRFDHAYKDDVVAPADPNYNFSSSEEPVVGSDGKLVRNASSCEFDYIRQIYLQDEENIDQYCWYCKIVVVLVNAYLKVAGAAIDSATLPLGKIILKLGFLIWLAYYILKQVSSLNPITPAKMAQEILVMGFKVALAYAAIDVGIALIRDYYLNPVMDTGVKYGLAIFNKMNAGS